MSSYEHLTFMLSLPRSRSAWMAEFMKPYCVASLHNPLQQCASIEELGTKLDALPAGRVFVSDVAGLFFFEQLVTRFPGAQFLIVHRPAREVEHSMRKIGVEPPLNVRKAEKQLLDIANSIRHHHWTMTGTFFELNSPQVLAAIARFASGATVEPRHLYNMMQRNVQVPIAEQIARTDMMKAEKIAAEIADAQDVHNGANSPVSQLSGLMRRLERKAQEVPELLNEVVARLDESLIALDAVQAGVDGQGAAGGADRLAEALIDGFRRLGPLEARLDP